MGKVRFSAGTVDWLADSTDVLSDISMARREVEEASLSLTTSVHMQQSAGPIPGFAGNPAMILY